MATNYKALRDGTFRVQGAWDGAEVWVTVENQRPRRLAAIHPAGRAADLIDLQPILYQWGVRENGHWSDVSAERSDGRAEEVVNLQDDGEGSGPAVQGCCKRGCCWATDTVIEMGGIGLWLCDAHAAAARKAPHLFTGAEATLREFCDR